jgi:hypothetical protein
MTILKTKQDIDALCVGFKQFNNPFNKKPEDNDFHPPPKKRLKSYIKSFVKYLAMPFCSVKLIKNPLKLIKIPVSANLFLDNVYGPPTCGMFFKRDSFIKSGGYNQEYYPTDDWIFMIFFASHYNVFYLNRELAGYVWGNNLSTTDETLEGFKNHRKQIILSLTKKKILCRLIFYLLQNDFKKKMETRLEVHISYSRLYTIMARLYSRWLGR